MKRRIMTISLLAPLVLLGCIFARPHLSAMARASQGRTGRQQPRGRTPARRARPAASAAIDYSSFSHRSRSHQQQSCASCHKTPTPDWRTARAFPDITDYPGHESCVSCHRQQFFNGARPNICSVCHTRTSPRDDARFAFGQPDLSPRPPRAKNRREFTIEFPHDKHQDVIAQLRPARPARAEASFTLASFWSKNGTPTDDQARFNNCTLCHQTNRALPQAPRDGWPGAYAPPPETFKTAPASHASCFNCHWQSQAPVSKDCAGCHKPSAPFTPASWPRRISAKFIHEGGGTDPDITKRAHIAECTTCHINITKASTLRGLKPDVPIAACATCHTNNMLVTYRNMKTIEMELDQFEKSRNCAYCHTPDVGREPAPQSHCLAVGQPITQCRQEK